MKTLSTYQVNQPTTTSGHSISVTTTIFGTEEEIEYIRQSCADCEIKDKIRKALNERPQGEWNVIDYDKLYYKHDCCNEMFEYPYNYCPNCGAKMKGGTK